MWKTNKEYHSQFFLFNVYILLNLVSIVSELSHSVSVVNTTNGVLHVSDFRLTKKHLYLLFNTGLKNEDGYEISIPFEDSHLDDSGFYSPNDHTFDGIFLSPEVFDHHK